MPTPSPAAPDLSAPQPGTSNPRLIIRGEDRRPARRFRAWLPPKDGFPGQLWELGTLHDVYLDGYHCGMSRWEDLVLMEDTGLHALASPNSPLLYEGDIISFTIRGAAHGRDPDHCAAAHIWWSQEDACWAFGQWTSEITLGRGSSQEQKRTYQWHYMVSDSGFDHSSIQLLGNVFENPELLAKLAVSYGRAPEL